MKIIKLTKNVETIVDDEDYKYLSQFKWCCCSKGYAVRNIWVNSKSKTIRMHRVIMNAPDDKFVDHINSNPLDNRKENLRLCNPKDNNKNRKKLKRNTSGYIGVSWYKASNKWQSIIGFNSKRIRLGLFNNKIDAAKAYDKAAIELRGDFTKLNFPKRTEK